MIQSSLIIFCIIMFAIGYFFEPRKVNPITIFYGEWAIIIFLANLNLYSILVAEDIIYEYILIGCIVFAIGFYLMKICKMHIKFRQNTKILNKNIENIGGMELNLKMVYILTSITLIFLVFDSANGLILLTKGYSLDFIRQQAQEGFQYSNVFMNAIRILIATPFSFALMPIIAIELFKNKKNKKLIILAFMIIIFRIISDGGRSIFIYLIMSFILCFFYQDSKGTVKKKVHHFGIIKIKRNFIYFSLFIMAGIFFLWYLTVSRSGENTIRYAYYYFAMEPIMFEKWSYLTDATNLYGFGMASFNGFLFPVFYIITNIFGIPYPTYWRQVYDLIERVGNEWQIITTGGLTANSYASIFWNFYLDGRLFGIIIGMFLFGMFISLIYVRVLKCQNEKRLANFCLIMIGLFYSFQFVIFENIYNAIAFFMLNFIMYRKVNR